MVGGSELSLHQRGPRDLPGPCQLISLELPTSSPRESHHDLASLGGIHSVSPISILHIYPVASRGPGVQYVPSLLLSSSSGPPRSPSRLVPPLFHEILQILNFVPAHNSWAKTSQDISSRTPWDFITLDPLSLCAGPPETATVPGWGQPFSGLEVSGDKGVGTV